MSDLIDFDAFRAEHSAEPIRLKLGGKIYELPPTFPAMAALDIVRMQATIGAGAKVPEMALEAIGVSLFGEKNFREILNDNRLTMTELSELIQHVMSRYSGVPLPNRAARRKKGSRSRS